MIEFSEDVAKEVIESYYGKNTSIKSNYSAFLKKLLKTRWIIFENSEFVTCQGRHLVTLDSK